VIGRTIALLAVCSGTALARPAAPSSKPIQLTIARRAPIAIAARIERGDAPAKQLAAAFDIEYVVTARGTLGPTRVRSRVMCRLQHHNVVIPDPPDELTPDAYALKGPRTELVRTIHALAEAPEACEIAFAYGKQIDHELDDSKEDDAKEFLATEIDGKKIEDPANEQIVATMCLRAAGLSDGPCPRATFPRPVLPAGFTIGLTEGGYKFVHTTDAIGIVLNGGFSFLSQPRFGRYHEVMVRCEDGSEGHDHLEHLTNAWLQVVPVGASLAATGVLRMHPEPTDHPGRCELTIESGVPAGMHPTLHGKYCLSDQRTEPGPCRPPLVIAHRAKDQPPPPKPEDGKP
jgi:hypothetical protein